MILFLPLERSLTYGKYTKMVFYPYLRSQKRYGVSNTIFDVYEFENFVLFSFGTRPNLLERRPNFPYSTHARVSTIQHLDEAEMLSHERNQLDCLTRINHF